MAALAAATRHDERSRLDDGLAWLHDDVCIDSSDELCLVAKKEKHIGRMDSCEKQLFFEAMTKEWKQLFELGALRLLTPEESKAVP